MDDKKNFTIEELIENSFDFSTYSEEEKKKLIEESSNLILETALIRTLDEANEETQKKFQEFLETEPDAEAMAQFVEENFPNFGEKIVEEYQHFMETKKDGSKEEKDLKEEDK